MNDSRKKKNQGPFPWKIHPIWRGIGLIFMVIVPLLSLGLADLILPQLEQPLPAYLAQVVSIPGIGEVESFFARALLTLVISVPLFLLISIAASIIYSFFGGHRTEELAKLTKKYPGR